LRVMTSGGGGTIQPISGISLGPCQPTICVNIAQDEADSLGGDWPHTGSSGTTPAGKSATGSSGRAGTAGGSSKQVGTSHQSGQTRDAQPNAFGTAGNAAATGAPSSLLTSVKMLYCCTVQGRGGFLGSSQFAVPSSQKASGKSKTSMCTVQQPTCCAVAQRRLSPFLS